MMLHYRVPEATVSLTTSLHHMLPPRGSLNAYHRANRHEPRLSVTVSASSSIRIETVDQVAMAFMTSDNLLRQHGPNHDGGGEALDDDGGDDVLAYGGEVEVVCSVVMGGVDCALDDGEALASCFLMS
ncbi:hypothetical protein RIF29_27304 [Crotalaria pallida]|uniref:Uncharacterized protein n=1 Tax=Crotalaria pallida TaxID=3830 RepID=A0AAN9ER59_CROPI